MDSADRRRAALTAIMKERNLSLNGWAKLAEVPESALRGFMSGRTDGMNITTYEKLAAAAETTVSRLIGEDHFTPPELVRTAIDSVDLDGGMERVVDPTCGSAAFILDRIAEVDVRGGMGGGGVAMALNHTDQHGNTISIDGIKAAWDLPSDYLRHELRVSAAQARIIEVQGDSMEPTLRPGDRVMVNLDDKRPSPPGVFALWDGMGVVVKRLQHITNSDPPRLRIISDNDRHEPEELTAEEVNIIGRVVWFARRM